MKIFSNLLENLICQRRCNCALSLVAMTHILLDSPAQYSSRFTTVARPRFRTCCRSPSHPRLDIQRSAHSKLKRKPYTKCPESPYPHALHICTQGSRGRREVTCQEHKLSRGHSRGILLPALCVTLGIALGVFSNPALAFTIHQEPENALSFPTWVIHISSVVEWAIAMALVWKYAEVTGMH